MSRFCLCRYARYDLFRPMYRAIVSFTFPMSRGLEMCSFIPALRDSSTKNPYLGRAVSLRAYVDLDKNHFSKVYHDQEEKERRRMGFVG